MSANNVVRMSELNKVASEIDKHATNELVYKRLDEYKQGLNELYEETKGVYKDNTIKDMVGEYIENKLNDIHNELNSYDKRSNALIAKANTIIHQLESDMQSMTDPTTQYELEQHNYLVDKLKNNLFTVFTGSKPSIEEIEETLKQADNNKGYARALTHLRATLLNNIENNNIPLTTKQQLRTDIKSKMEELKASLLPFKYKQLLKIKQDISKKEIIVQGTKHHFELMKDNAEGKDLSKYKISAK